MKIAHFQCGQGNFLAAQNIARQFQRVGGGNATVKVGQHTPTVTVRSYFLQEFMEKAHDAFLKANSNSYAAKVIKNTVIKNPNAITTVNAPGEVLSTLG